MIIEQLIYLLPQILCYIVVGCTFINIYHFVALRQNTKDINNLLTESLVIGFIYDKIMELVPISFGAALDNLGILISAVIISYMLGRLRTNKRILILFDKLKIYNTGNIYLWDDLMDADYSMKAVIEYTEKSYEGYIHYIESYSNSPHIALCFYIL